MGADLFDRRFRASQAFGLVGFDTLAPTEQRLVASLRRDPDFFGLLKPVDPMLPAKSVSKEAALLFLTLQLPQRIPALLESIFGHDPRALLGLLADSVLEVEHEGAFVSGQAALQLFVTTARRAATHATAIVSSAAIECAATYEGVDAATLAGSVYAYGRQPCTEALRRRFVRDADVLGLLADDPRVADLLTSRWAMDARPEAPWLLCSSDHPAPHLGYKLYVSARLEAMPRLFGMAVRALHRVRCTHFKLGRRAEDMCRPDKMVAYFTSLEHLQECAGLIERDLASADMPPSLAQPVPFTAGIDPVGFLTWGIDPPELARLTDGLEYQSWRQWIAYRVAVAVLSAKTRVMSSEVLPFVLERLALDGIDPETWAPTLAIWRGHAARPGDVA